MKSRKPIVANTFLKATFIFCAATFWTPVANSQVVSDGSKAGRSPITFPMALSWLPADTETLIVANGPFVMPQRQNAEEETKSRLLSLKEIRETFESLPLGLVGLQQGALEKKFTGREVAFAIEGARSFRSPSGLGEMTYEGCDIVVFTHDVTSLGVAFMEDSKGVATKFEEVEGQRVGVFDKKMEEDIWTTMVAFPKGNVLVVATDRDYLRGVLARIGGAGGPRALPDGLPEWKYVNIDDHAWGLRHYDKRQAEMDPSSPIGGEKSANIPDDDAIGIVFNLDASRGRTATITYLSKAKDVLAVVKANLFPPGSEEDSVKDLRIRYREIGPGVVRASFDLMHSEPVWYFTFVLMAVLGHGVYL
jgi:hypothetical protein